MKTKDENDVFDERPYETDTDPHWYGTAPDYTNSPYAHHTFNNFPLSPISDT